MIWTRCVSGWRQVRSGANALSSVEQYTIMIAASIPIIVPVLRWIGEKLSYYRYVIASWTRLNKKMSKGRDSLEEQDGIVKHDEPAECMMVDDVVMEPL